MAAPKPADLFEFKVDPASGNMWPKRVDPVNRGLVGRYVMALVEGVVSRFGGALELWNEDNSAQTVLRTEGKKFSISLLGKEVFSIEQGASLSLPQVSIGEPGASWIEMYQGQNKVYVWVTPSGKLSVRKTRPPIS